ncbi:GAF domain-containing protein [Halobacillus shinanisalinarum]|uniref:GAF domain-containing protein n=1 Tax=Halobacillus shinanisalinarum TaxID=2932258 RepID=A0ABY4GUA3_9BACI|nr:STAS domain-containing protein [Halobacillus shinanisalinarum]UOQ91599.1 GAF domain-containing protein [Halobacillus shinanisalinarum]
MYNHSTDLNYLSVNEAANEILEHVSQILDVNTVYIAKKEDGYVNVMETYNREEHLLGANVKVDYEETYCQFVIETGGKVFTSTNMSQDPIAKNIELPPDIQIQAFMGTIIYDKEHKEFGTLCVMDQKPREFTEKEAGFLRSVGKVFGYIISLDQMQQRVDMLSVPIVPVTEGVVVLPLIGIVNEDRSNHLLETILQRIYQKNVDYFILDLSGLVSFDDLFTNHLSDIIKALELMGVTPVLTGVRPDMAMSHLSQDPMYKNLRITRNLEQALKKVGLSLIKDH